VRADDPGVLRAAAPRASEAPAVAAELLARYRQGRLQRPVSVTELVDPRPAYWESVHPVPTLPEQAARQREGRRLHERVTRALAPLASREVRVRREGIVGRVDVLLDRPMEVKSTANPPDPGDDLRQSRPSYVEQVAMYAALLDRTEGRLLVVGSDPSTAPTVWDLGAIDPGRVRLEMAARAAGLRQARDRGDPSGLPRCGWYGRGCSFEREGVCHCDGSEPGRSAGLLDLVPPPVLNPSEADRVAEALRAPPPPEEPIARFRDLVFPRRGYFESDPSTEEDPKVGEGGTSGETWRALHDLLEGGEAGELVYRYASGGVPEEPVACFRDEPCLVKTTRSTWPTPAAQLVADRPHYVLELALRCAAVGTPAGWLVLGLERVPSDGEWVRVQRVDFGSPEGLNALLAERVGDLRAARQRRSPAGLPVCPPWMPGICPYRGVCGCPAESGRA
jgi:hypothetical protein